MQTLLRLIATLALALGAHTAHARGDGDIWIMVVGPMCLSQYPSHASTEMGKIFLRGAAIDDFVERPFARCFRQHNWASRNLCEDVMGLQKEQMRDLQSVHERHRDEIRRLKPAFDYFNSYINQDPASPSWPFACPEEAR
ncbi:hypothetical protein [Methyloversatilis discipulorum]|uniref:hypothetical protein n=1 Tax=Methyloversatilis discipulorum TaxID=1119528 RepID=UPI001A412F2A|nr:hypothetical protein [Methyloversatilis discipulorum]MBL8469090.1 hypothetical protein [Methyloversatilis discipulorum]